MNPRFPEIGVCGLSCRLCPRYHTTAASRCTGCKGAARMAVGCPFITCAVKRKGIEFCWECDESDTCERWAAHRRYGLEHDTFVCYATLESNIEAIRRDGLEAFVEDQCRREALLTEMLDEFNEGRSKTFYSIAATLLDPAEVRAAVDTARETIDSACAPSDSTRGAGDSAGTAADRTRRDVAGLSLREKSKILHSLLDNAAERRSVRLNLRR